MFADSTIVRQQSEHPLRTFFYIFAFLVVISATYTLEKRIEMVEQNVMIDYN